MNVLFREVNKKGLISYLSSKMLMPDFVKGKLCYRVTYPDHKNMFCLNKCKVSDDVFS